MINLSSARLRRWAGRGALILAGLAIVLGGLFTCLIAVAQQNLPREAIGWLPLLARTVLIWGGGGLFFGAILGAYASLIWRDPDV